MGWQENILAKHRETVAAKRIGGPFGRDLRPLQFYATVEFVRFLDAAAKAKGVNRSSFVRRALAVAAAGVLGTDVRRILFESPCVKTASVEKAIGSTAGVRDDGSGIESWCPHPGCSGEHLLR